MKLITPPVRAQMVTAVLDEMTSPPTALTHSVIAGLSRWKYYPRRTQRSDQ
jgi:hypothetical protein